MKVIHVTNGKDTIETTQFYWDMVGKGLHKDFHIKPNPGVKPVVGKEVHTKPKQDVQLQKKAGKTKEVTEAGQRPQVEAATTEEKPNS